MHNGDTRYVEAIFRKRLRHHVSKYDNEKIKAPKYS